MRTVLVLMDTLRRDVLSCYNPTTDVQTPNLDAFADQSCVFDNHWIGPPAATSSPAAITSLSAPGVPSSLST